MKAVRVGKFGGVEELRVEEISGLEPGPGQILVRLKAAGVNPVDAYPFRRLRASPLLALYTGNGWGRNRREGRFRRYRVETRRKDLCGIFGHRNLRRVLLGGFRLSPSSSGEAKLLPRGMSWCALWHRAPCSLGPGEGRGR